MKNIIFLIVVCNFDLDGYVRSRIWRYQKILRTRAVIFVKFSCQTERLSVRFDRFFDFLTSGRWLASWLTGQPARRQYSLSMCDVLPRNDMRRQTSKLLRVPVSRTQTHASNYSRLELTPLYHLYSIRDRCSK